MTDKITDAIEDLRKIRKGYVGYRYSPEKGCVQTGDSNRYTDAIDMAIEALEYRKPKPVVKIPYGWECPVCKAFWATYKGNFIDTDFCPNCGQALDWSE